SEEPPLAAVFLLQFRHGRVHVRVRRRVDPAGGLLAEQDAGDDVLPGVPAELRVPLAAGDVAQVFVVRLDVGELRVEDGVLDPLAVDDEWHGLNSVDVPDALAAAGVAGRRPSVMEYTHAGRRPWPSSRTIGKL